MQRADSENALYVEPMLFSNSTASNLGSNVWTGGTLTTADLAVVGFPASVPAKPIGERETGGGTGRQAWNSMDNVSGSAV